MKMVEKIVIMFLNSLKMIKMVTIKVVIKQIVNKIKNYNYKKFRVKANLYLF